MNWIMARKIPKIHHHNRNDDPPEADHTHGCCIQILGSGVELNDVDCLSYWVIRLGAEV